MSPPHGPMISISTEKVQMQVARTGPDCPLYFLTPVWGADYIDLFVDVVIPSQLAPGNLPAIKSGRGSRYLIFTTREDAEVLRAAAAFRRLSEILPVDVVLIDRSSKAPHDIMSDCYRQGIAAAEAAGAAVVFLTPDLIHADGNFAAIQRWLQEGYDAVFTTGIRTEKRGVVRAVNSAFVGPDGAIVVQPRELVRIGLDNLHPNGRASFFTEGDEDLIPANLYWRAGSAGFVARCFHLHPIVVRPQCPNVVFQGTVDDDYVAVAVPDPSNDYVVKDSDEFMMIELSDAKRTIPTQWKKGSVAHVAEWAEQFANARHRRLFSVPIRIHTEVDNESALTAAEEEAARVAEAVQQMLGRPTLELLMSGDSSFYRRVVRRGLDANILLERSNSELAGELPWQLRAKANLSGFFRRSEYQLIKGLYWTYGAVSLIFSAALRKVEGTLYGTARKPRYFSLRRQAYRQINREVAAAIGTIEGGGQTGGERFDQIAHDLSDLSVAFSQNGARIVNGIDEEPVAEGSLPLLVVDRNLPNSEKLPAFFAAVAGALAKNGRLVVVAQNKGYWAESGSSCVSAERISSELENAGFNVICQRLMGDRETVLSAHLAYAIAQWNDQMRRRLKFFPLFFLLQSGIVLPLKIIFKPVVDMAIWCWCRFDSSRAEGQYFASVTVAANAPREQNNSRKSRLGKTHWN